ncbi:Cytochrome b2 [Lachnellula suecica]|uniref:Cytochrome b2 n=1 Tax=Lachnellula suecica TaxID=602035 RepID=A0A8T9C7Z1_9HELO|nr:Cytochrome b2 [Lachnellula suecica]
MHSSCLFLTLAATAFAARPFLNEADTGIEDALDNIPAGTLPPLTSMVGLPDFGAARNYLPIKNYTYYRNGAAGEWSYRNNLEVFSRYRLRPRVLVDITNVEASLPSVFLPCITILSSNKWQNNNIWTTSGHNLSAPFFISPAARADYGHVDAEAGLAKGAYDGNIL